ncbi:GNAT family N-acetyltransferase [Neolewinella antarctica]|uniref:GNAT superfamily N-acetyltransferase n=1 Tax=Neolewinella antarctica TaxID=442734 RepID=A0ABX0XEC6_9BACT|nr:GNAT family N-acetyltransferase [Neolewinella antarctica]NJC27107.1 GNAT superfamily N-acetyltransferase [Neolewinella antarctica]
MPPDLSFRSLNPTHAPRVVELVHLLNPAIPTAELAARLVTQWDFDGYYCFGLFRAEELIGVASAWVSVRLYGGKLVELDNVIVDPAARGGTGSYFMEQLQAWARAENCVRMELKTYVTNARSHKFYFDHGFDLRAFYFVKALVD